MSPEMLFDYLAVRLNSEKATGKVLSINTDFTDIDSQYTLTVENAVLNHSHKPTKEPDVSLSMTMKTMNSIQLKELTFDEAIESRDLKLTGNKAFFDGFLGMLDNFNFWFNIVTP